jgi:hypothetical protein
MMNASVVTSIIPYFYGLSTVILNIFKPGRPGCNPVRYNTLKDED